jgi:hypothetical protein
MKKSETASRELLQRLYVDERKPTEAIGEELGMTGRYIRMLLKKFGIETRTDGGRFNKGEKSGSNHHFRKGVPSWSKGLTKLTHPSIARLAASKIGKPRLDIKGEKHPHWKGGATTEALLIRNSKAYVRWRDAVFTRDDFTCVDCCTRGGRLHAHHVLSFASHPDLRLDVGNGVTVCIACHSRRHPDQPALKNRAASLEHRRSMAESARIYWSDPANRQKHSARIKASMTDERRKQISESKMGSVPWNKGLTKEESPSLVSTGEKNRERMQGKTGKDSNVWKRWHPED